MHRVLVSGGRLVLSVWRAVDRTPGFLVLGQALARHISPQARIAGQAATEALMDTR